MRNNTSGVVIVTILLVLVGGYFLCKNILEKEEKKEVVNDEVYVMYISINPIIKLEFKESYIECDDKKAHNKCDLKTEIIGYELINEEARRIYKNLSLSGKDVKEVIPLLVQKIYDAGMAFTTINIKTNWLYGYSANSIYSYLVSNNYHQIYKVNVEELRNLNEEIDINKEFVSKTIIKDKVAIANVGTLTNHEYEPSLINTIKYTINLYGTKEVIDSLNESELDIYIDLTDYKKLDFNSDVSGKYTEKIYLNTDKDLYYEVKPNKLDFEILYSPTYNWSINNDEIKKILDNYKLSTVNLDINQKDAISCFYNEGEVICAFTGTNLTIPEVKQVFDRFKIMYNSDGYIVGADNLPSACKHSSYKTDSMMRFNCIKQLKLTLFKKSTIEK